MEKRTIHLEDREEKKTKKGDRYYRYKTNNGWMSCFDSDVCEELNKYEGRTVAVMVKTKDNYTNITNFVELVEGDAPLPTSIPVEVIKPQDFGKKSTSQEINDNVNIYTAKDIFNSIIINTKDDKYRGNYSDMMDDAIVLTKKLREAFK